jgi:methylglutaconyl-CoA hydratase
MSDSRENPPARCHVDERGVATLTLDRATKHNAFDDAMIASLQHELRRLADDDSVRVVILAGAGKSFSAGGDLAWMQRMAAYDYGHNLDDARALADMLYALKTLPHPTIARVQGNAFGGAIGLICCCDLAVASADARFGLTETRIGLIPATIGPHVVEALGPRWARRLFLTAERFDAEMAERIGLVHERCPVDDLDARVATLIDQLLANGPEALREAKQLCREILYRPVDEDLLADTSARIAHIRVSAEGQEGLKAFLEKRPPAWTPGDDH